MDFVYFNACSGGAREVAGDPMQISDDEIVCAKCPRLADTIVTLRRQRAESPPGIAAEDSKRRGGRYVAKAGKELELR